MDSRALSHYSKRFRAFVVRIQSLLSNVVGGARKKLMSFVCCALPDRIHRILLSANTLEKHTYYTCITRNNSYKRGAAESAHKSKQE